MEHDARPLLLPVAVALALALYLILRFRQTAPPPPRRQRRRGCMLLAESYVGASDVWLRWDASTPPPGVDLANNPDVDAWPATATTSPAGSSENATTLRLFRGPGRQKPRYLRTRTGALGVHLPLGTCLVGTHPLPMPLFGRAVFVAATMHGAMDPLNGGTAPPPAYRIILAQRPYGGEPWGSLVLRYETEAAKDVLVHHLVNGGQWNQAKYSGVPVTPDLVQVWGFQYYTAAEKEDAVVAQLVTEKGVVVVDQSGRNTFDPIAPLSLGGVLMRSGGVPMETGFCTIHEVVVYAGLLADADLRATHQSLTKKWTVVAPPPQPSTAAVVWARWDATSLAGTPAGPVTEWTPAVAPAGTDLKFRAIEGRPAQWSPGAGGGRGGLQLAVNQMLYTPENVPLPLFGRAILLVATLHPGVLPLRTLLAQRVWGEDQKPGTTTVRLEPPGGVRCHMVTSGGWWMSPFAQDATPLFGIPQVWALQVTNQGANIQALSIGPDGRPSVTTGTGKQGGDPKPARICLGGTTIYGYGASQCAETSAMTVHELVMYKDALSAADLQLAHAALADKWRATLPAPPRFLVVDPLVTQGTHPGPIPAGTTKVSWSDGATHATGDPQLPVAYVFGGPSNGVANVVLWFDAMQGAHTIVGDTDRSGSTLAGGDHPVRVWAPALGPVADSFVACRQTGQVRISAAFVEHRPYLHLDGWRPGVRIPLGTMMGTRTASTALAPTNLKSRGIFLVCTVHGGTANTAAPFRTILASRAPAFQPGQFMLRVEGDRMWVYVGAVFIGHPTWTGIHWDKKQFTTKVVLDQPRTVNHTQCVVPCSQVWYVHFETDPANAAGEGGGMNFRMLSGTGEWESFSGAKSFVENVTHELSIGGFRAPNVAETECGVEHAGCTIHELVMYHSRMHDASIADVHARIRAKWGVT